MQNESKEERFKRVAEKRVQNIIKSIRGLSQLTNKKVNKWNSVHLTKIWSAIEKEVELCKKSFQEPDTDGNFVTNRMLEMSILPGMSKNRLFIPIHAPHKMIECFRRRVIRFFLNRELITESFVTNMDVGNLCEVRDDESIPSNLLSWKNSGFSIDAKLRLYGSDDKTRESIAQYLVRPPPGIAQSSTT